MRHRQGCEDKHTEGINQQSNLRAAMVPQLGRKRPPGVELQ